MRQIRKARFRLFRGQKGISLIEVLVSIGILALIGMVMIGALDTSSRSVRTVDEQVTAGRLATAYIEAIKQSTYSPNYTSATANITVPAQYTVNVDVLASSNGVDYVPATGNPTETLQKIIVSVNRQGKPVLNICTMRSKR